MKPYYIPDNHNQNQFSKFVSILFKYADLEIFLIHWEEKKTIIKTIILNLLTTPGTNEIENSNLK